MKNLRNQCQIIDPHLELSVSGEGRITFTIKQLGDVANLRRTQRPPIIAHLYVYADDAHVGDQLLLQDSSYGIKNSNSGSPDSPIEDRTHIPFWIDPALLNEDHRGKDEIYVLFFLTMTLPYSADLEVDALISEVVRTNTVQMEF